MALLVAAACTRGAGGQGSGQRRAPPAPPTAVPKVPVEAPLTATTAGKAVHGSTGGLPSAAAQVTLNIDGVRRRLGQAVGQVLLVHVWATWCAPCLYELPEFDKLVEKASARGVQVLALAVDSEYRDIARIADVLRTRAPHLAPVVADYGGKNEFFQLFSRDWAGSIPATFIFDRTGKLHSQFLNIGEFRQMNAALDQLLGQR